MFFHHYPLTYGEVFKSMRNICIAEYLKTELLANKITTRKYSMLQTKF